MANNNTIYIYITMLLCGGGAPLPYTILHPCFTLRSYMVLPCPGCRTSCDWVCLTHWVLTEYWALRRQTKEAATRLTKSYKSVNRRSPNHGHDNAAVGLKKLCLSLHVLLVCLHSRFSALRSWRSPLPLPSFQHDCLINLPKIYKFIRPFTQF